MLASDNKTPPPNPPVSLNTPPPRRNKFQIGDIVKMKGWEGIRLLVVDFDLDKDKTRVAWEVSDVARERWVSNAVLWKG
jgi:hypothetical protein